MPALTKGDFSALTDIYAPIQVPLMRIQQNPTVLKDYDETFPVFNEMAMNQNVGFDAEFLDPRSGKNMRAHWLQDEDSGTMDADSTDCIVPDADEVGAHSTDYTPATAVTKGLKTVDQKTYDLKSFQQKLAFGFASRLFHVMRYAEKDAITQILAFQDDATGLNTQGVGTMTTTWNIGTADVVPELLYRIKQQAMDLRMIDPVLIVGKNYEYAEMKFRGERGINLTTDANALLNQQLTIPIIRDRNHYDTIAGDNSMLLVDRATIGYFSQNYWDNDAPQDKVMEENNHFTYSTPLPRLFWRNMIDGRPLVQNVRADVRFALKCVNEYETALVHRFKLLGKWVESPKGVNDYPTVIRIVIT